MMCKYFKMNVFTIIIILGNENSGGENIFAIKITNTMHRNRNVPKLVCVFKCSRQVWWDLFSRVIYILRERCEFRNCVTRSNMLFRSCYVSWWERCEDQHNLGYFWSEPGSTSSHLFASDVWESNTVWGKRLWLSRRVMAFLYLSGNRLDFQ